MINEFNKRVTINKLLNDCLEIKIAQQTYEISYLEFLKYFNELETITKHNLIIGINFTYGWMPTIFNFRSKNFNDSLKILNNAKNEIIPSSIEFEILKALFNNSLVGTTKLLHFICPNKFAIWDSRVYHYLTGKKANNQSIGNCKNYLSYLSFCNNVIETKDYEMIHRIMCDKLGYPTTKLRTIELIMYHNGKLKC